jgi:hypothetical protein
MNFSDFVLFQDVVELLEAVSNPAYYFKPETGKRLTSNKSDIWERIQLIFDDQVDKGVPQQNLWISFSEYPKLGVHYAQANRDGKSTPSGVFGYPMGYALSHKNSIPSFSDRPFIIAFKSKAPVFNISNRPDDNPRVAQLQSDLRNEPNPDESRRRAIATIKNSATKKGLNEKALSAVFRLLDHIKFEDTNSMSDDNAGEIINRTANSLRSIIFDTFNNAHVDSFGSLISQSRYSLLFDSIDSDNRTVSISPQVKEKFWERYERIKDEQDYDADWKALKRFFEPDKLTFSQALDFMSEIGRGVNDTRDDINNLEFIEKTDPKLLKRILLFSLKRVNRQHKINLAGHTPVEQQDFPKKAELQKIANELQIDFNQALRLTLGNRTVGSAESFSIYNDPQFIYRLTQRMAKSWADKIGKPINWPVRWNIILRKIGYSNATDVDGSSAIHSGESHQGVFLDPRTIEVIDIIANRKSNYPSPNPHDINQYKFQRNSNSNIHLEDDPYQNMITGLDNKIMSSFRGFSNNPDLTKKSVDMLNRSISMVSTLKKKGINVDRLVALFVNNIWEIDAMLKSAKHGFSFSGRPEIAAGLQKLKTAVTALQQ